MATNTYQIRRLDDRSLHGLFERAKKAAIEASSQEDLEGHAVTVETVYEGNSLQGRIDFDDEGPSSGKYVVMQASLKLQTLGADGSNHTRSHKGFSIRRGEQGELDQFDIPQRGGGGAEAVWNDGKARAALLAGHAILTDALAPVDADPGTPVGQLTNFAASIDASFRGFTQSIETTLQSLADQRAAEAAHNERERERLRKEIEEERKHVLETAQSEIDARSKQLDQRATELSAREAELEIKSHKDARRQLFRKLQEDLLDSSTKPTSSFSVLMARWAVFLALTVLGGAAAAFALNSMSVDTLPENSTAFQVWVVILKPIGLSLLSLGSFAAAVQWLRHFYTHDLRAAEDTQRFGHDMVRASWIMEAYLEMTKEHDLEEVPESWMANVTEGLFQGGSNSGQFDEGAQALAALLGMSASAKVSPDGFEANINRSNLQKIAKSANSDPIDR